MLIDTGRSIAGETVERLVIGAPYTLGPDDSLMSAAALMLNKMIRRLPVVEDGHLMGTLSRADLIWGIMVLDSGRRG